MKSSFSQFYLIIFENEMRNLRVRYDFPTSGFRHSALFFPFPYHNHPVPSSCFNSFYKREKFANLKTNSDFVPVGFFMPGNNQPHYKK